MKIFQSAKGAVRPFFFVRCRKSVPVIFISLYFFVNLPAKNYAKDAPEIIVKMKTSTRSSSFDKGAFEHNSLLLKKVLGTISEQNVKPVFSTATDISSFHSENYFVVRVDKVQSSSEILARLHQLPEVAWAETNHVFKLHSDPNDSLFSQQWALPKIGLPEAWDFGKGIPGVLVGIIDTGIDYHHEDLQGQLWVNSAEDLNGNGLLDEEDFNLVDDDDNGYVDDVIGWDFTDAPDFPDNGDFADPDNDPMDEFPGGHGTSVAGIIGARSNNITGISGIAPGARVMALRAGTSSGFLEEDDVAEAILYAVENGCKIINMSFGDVVFSHLIKDAIDYGVSKGAIFVASAGNSGSSELQFPAGYDESISVAASDRNDNLAPFSSFGAKIDLVAPGQEIMTTSVGNHYGAVNGTSFSAPMVSAALALLWSQNPADSREKITEKLFSGCNDLGQPGWDPYFGNGRLNVNRSFLQGNGGLVKISAPQTGSGVQADMVPIIGTAVGEEMREYALSYGMGKDSVNLVEIKSGLEQVVDDTLAMWDTRQLPDSLYTLELKMTRRDLSSLVQRVLVDLDRTTPETDSVRIVPMVINDYFGFLVEIFTDDQTIANLKYRHPGEQDFRQSTASGYFSDFHSFLISSKEIEGRIEFVVSLRNSSGLFSEEDNNGRYYQLDFGPENSFSGNFRLLRQEPGSGNFYPRSTDLNHDGLLDIIGNFKFGESTESQLGILNEGPLMLKKYLSDVTAFPRDVYDVDGDSIPELLAGYGGTSLLFPGNSLPEFSRAPFRSAGNDFWAARFFDFDGDEKTEILALQQNEWRLFQLKNPNQFSVTYLQSLENLTDGANLYGVPAAEIFDFDQDGKMNVVIGDYDGDVIVYENTGGTMLAPTFSLRLPGEDATHRMAAGDLDGDGLRELAVATKKVTDYVGESSVNCNYWVLSILKSVADDRYQIVWQKNFHGVVDRKNIYSGVTINDYDGDGTDELFFTPFPGAYFIKWETGDFRIKWFYRDVNANAVPKVAENKFLLSSDSLLSTWQIEAAGNRPLPPSHIWVTFADTHQVVLKWSEVTSAEGYFIERRDVNKNQQRNFQTELPSLLDSTVQANALYAYRVSAVDSSFSIPESYPGREVVVRPELLPVLINLNQPNPSQLLLEFNKSLGERSFEVNNFFLLPDSLAPLSAVRGENYSRVLLTFLQELREGRHRLRISGLFNGFDVPVFRDTFYIPLESKPKEKKPYLRSAEILSKKNLKLIFSEAMDRSSVENSANYRLIPEDVIVEATQDMEQKNVVYLHLTGKNRLGSLGEKYFLEISGVKNAAGVAIPQDYGNRVLLQSETTNLDKLVVFPNPFRSAGHLNEITFGNIPKNCEILIFTANGRKIIRLIQTSGSGGVKWNLKNKAGNLVSNGIYLYLARFSGQQKMGKFVIMR